MPKKAFTHQAIVGIKPANKRKAYFDTKTKGLGLRVTPTGTKTFFYRYYYGGKNKRYTIGRFGDISLAEARDKVAELRSEALRGNDPQGDEQAKKSESKPKMFEDLASRYKKKHISSLKQSTQRTYTNRIDSEMIPAFKGMYVKNISRGMIIELLEDIAIEREQPTHSNRVRAILSSMFTFAVEREIAEYNPVKTIKPLGEETQRDRVLEPDEIKRIWKGFDTLRDPIRSVFKILLLLGQRKGETCGMKWEDIEGDIWTIPKEKTKANRKHYVPLPPLAVEIIEGLDNDSPYVFESNRYKGKPVKWLHDAFKRVAKDVKVDNARIHDLRRTAATYMAELGTERTILGKVLNHKGLSGDSQVTARYDRYSYMDEKQTALNRWALKLEKIAQGKETKVTELKTAKTA